MNQLMQGAVVMGCAMIGLFFIRFWARSRDRLFIFFGIGFWLLGINWLALALSNRDESTTLLYVVRLCAFFVILVGIWDKNRSTRPQSERTSAR
jgi:hypothetical protein